ncbi:hypothetical protein LJC06_03260 [Bacteroidales bacterium OttesenSCG-928-I14]|nr:hypothetical protein [Bacteroidales bacterium OttesenSCG-928-I14]
MEDRIKVLEEKFADCERQMRTVSSKLYDFNSGIGELDSIDKDFADYWTHDYLYRMYNIICCYLELLNLNEYLKKFKLSYESIIEDRSKVLKFGTIPLRDGDYEDDFQLLIDWEKFLEPIGLFHSVESSQRNSLKRLLEFLECTNEIIKTTKTKVTKEEDINAIIRDVAKFFYSDVTVYFEGYFVHQFKHYRPDVIIKEIATSVEYKLIRQDKEIGIKLDELIIDAKRYTGNSRNKFCVAVFCLSQDVKRTKKEIIKEWSSMHFPNNWELVIITDVKIES